MQWTDVCQMLSSEFAIYNEDFSGKLQIVNVCQQTN